MQFSVMRFSVSGPTFVSSSIWATGTGSRLPAAVLFVPFPFLHLYILALMGDFMISATYCSFVLLFDPSDWAF